MTLNELCYQFSLNPNTVKAQFKRTKENLAKKGIIITKEGRGAAANYKVEYSNLTFSKKIQLLIDTNQKWRDFDEKLSIINIDSEIYRRYEYFVNKMFYTAIKPIGKNGYDNEEAKNFIDILLIDYPQYYMEDKIKTIQELVEDSKNFDYDINIEQIEQAQKDFYNEIDWLSPDTKFKAIDFMTEFIEKFKEEEK